MQKPGAGDDDVRAAALPGVPAPASPGRGRSRLAGRIRRDRATHRRRLGLRVPQSGSIQADNGAG